MDVSREYHYELGEFEGSGVEEEMVLIEKRSKNAIKEDGGVSTKCATFGIGALESQAMAGSFANRCSQGSVQVFVFAMCKCQFFMIGQVACFVVFNLKK